ncbi:MAG: DUF4401 domain-containing protein [Nitrospirales bacterium]
MRRKREQLWMTLVQAGLVQGEAFEMGKPDSPWYVKVLLAISGWLAALFLLGFIGVGFDFVFKNSSVAFIIGCLMIGGAFALLGRSKNEFVEHVALALSLAGQALVGLAIFDISGHHEAIVWLLVALVQVLLGLLMPNFVHRIFSTFVATFAVSMALTHLREPYTISSVVMFLAAWCWLNEFRYPQQMRKIQAIGYGFILALIQQTGAGMLGFGPSHHLTEIWVKPWIGEGLTGAVALFVVWQLLQRYGQTILSRRSIEALLGTFLLCLVSMKVQGLTVGMVIIMLGFVSTNRILLGLGIVSLLFCISGYYYRLDATLLAKSQNLFLVGLVLLALRWVIISGLTVNKNEVKHA